MRLGRLAAESFEAVLFDMDGTLIDSTPAIVRSWTRWGEEHHVTPEALLGHHGVPSAMVVARLLPEDRRPAAVERINELELTDTAGVVVLPGAAEALTALRAARAAIVTSCTVPLARARISAAALQIPAVLVTADDVTHGKPAPDPFLEAARRLGVDPRRCLVVEDAPQGLQAARAAGCRTLAVTTTTPADQLSADAIVDGLAGVRFEVDGDLIRVRLASAG